MNKSLPIHFVRIIVAVLFVSAGLAVGQTVLNLLSFAFSITNTGIANPGAIWVNASKTFMMSVVRLAPMCAATCLAGGL